MNFVFEKLSKNAGIALLAVTVVAMLILQMTGHNVAIEYTTQACTEAIENCEVSMGERKLSGLFVTAIIVGCVGLVLFVAGAIIEKRNTF